MTVRQLKGGLATMMTGAAANQAGAAIGAHAFPLIGPAGVVAVRQVVAAAVLLPVARPPLHRFRWPQWWPTILLGLVFATMNISLYTAVDRVGLGLAVTLEFLGPLGVALAGSRTRTDLICAGGAGIGVYVLVLPHGDSDWAGIGSGALAGGCWAAYIMLNRLLGQRLPGLQAPAAAISVSVLLYLPVLVWLIVSGRMTGLALLFGVAAGVFASAIPYAADLIALRRVPPRYFGVVMSVHPVFAALAGLVLLGEAPRAHEWTGILIVVAVNVFGAVVRGRAEAGPSDAVVDDSAPASASSSASGPASAPSPGPRPAAIVAGPVGPPGDAATGVDPFSATCSGPHCRRRLPERGVRR
ncbi:EamA family transporter [Actinoplanes siamensis]|nr:EamA family transporter [Actinoplanes siamensis]